MVVASEARGLAAGILLLVGCAGARPAEATASATEPPATVTATATAAPLAPPHAESATAAAPAASAPAPLSGAAFVELPIEAHRSATVSIPLGATSPRPLLVVTHGAGGRPELGTSR